MTRKGWWTDHKYIRRCVSKEGRDFFGYCGREKLEETASNLDDRTQKLFATLFCTGGRRGEVLDLKRRNFTITDNAVLVNNMIVFKQYKWVKENGENKKKVLQRGYRHFPINRRDPLVDYLIEKLEEKKPAENLFDFGESTLYRLICCIEKGEKEKHGPWFPHKLRAERASQLVVRYKFNKYLLKKWFMWTTDDTPDFYVKVGMADLMSAMGIVGEVPEVYGVKEDIEHDVHRTLKVQKEEESGISDIPKKKKLKTSKQWFFSEYPEEE